MYSNFEEMGPVYLRTPKERDEWEKIEKNFYERWNMPNELGAVDGKRINIVQPSKSGSHFRDYKGNDSVILMGVVGPEYEFINVSMNGRMSDSGNWIQNEFRKAISAEDNSLNFPPPKVLPTRTQPIPHFLVGDDAFALISYLVKPYAQAGLTEERRIFNYRLSRARRISENAFGILGNRWRVLYKNLQLESDTVTVLTLATFTRHNWLRSDAESGKIYVPSGLADEEDRETRQIIPGSWRADPNTCLDLTSNGQCNASTDAKEIRKEICMKEGAVLLTIDYCMKEGAVLWQWKVSI